MKECDVLAIGAGIAGASAAIRTERLGTLSQALAEVRTLTPSVREIGFVEAAAMVPVLKPDYVVAVVHEPGTMDIDVHALHHGYLRGLKRHVGCPQRSSRPVLFHFF